MEFVSALSTAPRTDAALEEALGAVLRKLPTQPDLVLAFATRHHLDTAPRIAAAIHDVARRVSAGAVAEGVIGGPREVEAGPGISLFAATLGAADAKAAHMEAVRTPQGVSVSTGDRLEGAVGALMIADVLSFPTSAFVARLADEGVPVMGGVADSGRGLRGAALMIDGKVHDHGAVVLWLGGAVELGVAVSQGCRPLGEPVIVTKATGTTVHQIAGRPAMEYLRDLFFSLEPADQKLAQKGLHLGVVMDEYRPAFGSGDFLIRAVTDIDDETGAIVVGDRVPVGRTIQFQVRDPSSAEADLRRLVGDLTGGGGVLLFTCNGRGRRFFGVPDHDARLVAEQLRPPALAGMFASGEIGPVGNGNYLHGYTATLVELRSP